jgi:putative transcriptional regulator
MTSRSRKPLFERLQSGLQECIAHTRGELTLKTISLPSEPPEIDAETLVALRHQAEMSQAVFASLLNVSPKTVQSWEQGIREPSMAARRLIHLFSQRPDVVCDVVGLPSIRFRGVRIVTAADGHRRIVVQAN